MQVLQAAMAEDLRSWRRRHDLTQPQMAEALDISLRLYCDVEAERKLPRDKEVRQAIQACLSGALTPVHDGERWRLQPSSGPPRLSDDAHRLTVAGALRRAEADTGVPVVSARVDESDEELVIVARLEDGREYREVRRPDGTTRTIEKPATVEAVTKKVQASVESELTASTNATSMGPVVAVIKPDESVGGDEGLVLFAFRVRPSEREALNAKAKANGVEGAQLMRAAMRLILDGTIGFRVERKNG